MRQRSETLKVATRRGLTDITQAIQGVVTEAGFREGLCTVFIRHTSASLVIQENADPAVCSDLESFLSRLVPDGDPLFSHVAEGDDDMPAHVKSRSLGRQSKSRFATGALRSAPGRGSTSSSIGRARIAARSWCTF